MASAKKETSETARDNTEVEPSHNMAKKTGFKKRPQKLTEFGPISAILITIAVYFGSQIIAAVGLGLYAAAKGLNQSQTVALLSGSTIAQFFYFLSVGIFTILLLRLFLNLRGVKWSDIGLKKTSLKNLLLAIPVFGVYFVSLIIVVAVISSFVPAINVEQDQQIGFDQAAGQIALAMVFISLVIVPSVSEEILIRGFLYGGLVKKLGKVSAALLASAIFGFAHLQLGSGNHPLWIVAIDTFVLSMFLIWLREKTGNIYAGMLVHAAKNSIAFVSIFIFHIK
ncbi:CPBP family intramembrane metalloprotease [Candidatus Parcubacteria bacterium]|nr:CPBP family intramembrane metalloprotease [Candidatus Parcubacteria bacterium]